MGLLLGVPTTPRPRDQSSIENKPQLVRMCPSKAWGLRRGEPNRGARPKAILIRTSAWGSRSGWTGCRKYLFAYYGQAGGVPMAATCVRIRPVLAQV